MGQTPFGILALVTGAINLSGIAWSQTPESPPTPVPAQFTSDTDEAYGFIENLQKQMCGKDPSHTCDLEARMKVAKSPEFMENMRKQAEKVGLPPGAAEEMVRQIFAETSTRFEMPGAFGLLSRLYDEVASSAANVGLTIPVKPALGSFPFKSVNAQSIVAPGIPRPMILFNYKMFELAHEMTKVLLESASTLKENALDFSRPSFLKTIQADPTLVEYFIRLTYEFLQFRTTQHRFAKTALGPLSEIRDGIELFIMAHEFGHVARQHGVAGAGPLQIGFASGTETITGAKGAIWNWRQEVEADHIGFIILGDIAKRRTEGGSGNLILLGPSLYFKIREMLTRAQQVINQNSSSVAEVPSKDREIYHMLVGSVLKTSANPDSAAESEMEKRFATTHPPASLRLETAKSRLNEMAAAGSIQQRTVALNEAMIARLDAFLQISLPTFQTLHEQGIRVEERAN